MPNTVVISPTTKALVGELFECVELGKKTLKGFPHPVEAWRADGIRSVASRFDALHPAGSLTPLVGRGREIGALLDWWQLVREGVGQAVAIGGDPGIGKSRILRALHDRLQPEIATVLQLQCSPYYVNSAFYPVARSLERGFQFQPDEPASTRLARMEQALMQDHARPAGDARLIAQIVALPTDRRYASLTTTPQHWKQETIRALIELVEAIAVKGRCLILFEDAHWADPSTLELLSGLIARVSRGPLFLLITHRPEFDPGVLAQEGLACLTLSRLSRAQGTVLATCLAGRDNLPAEVLDRILARSDGIPLFIEELTKATVESPEMTAAGRNPEPAPSDIPVPATLRDSLMARLDRLPEGKAIAQIGAVIGREFSYALLSAVAPLPRAELDRALSTLTQSGLTFRREGESGPVYVFKHALLQDIARDSLLRSARRELSGKVARALEERFPDATQAHPELLAHYYTEAALYDQAVEYWKRAGDLATQRSANLEAINQLERALLLAQSLPDGLARSRQELELHAILGRAMIAAKGYASPEVEQTFARARALFPQVDDSTIKFVVLRGECQLLTVQARYDRAFEGANELLRLANEEHNSGYLLDAHLLVGLSHLYRGNVDQACEHLERCAQLYDPVQHLPHAVRQGVDIGSAVLAYLARALWIQGYPDRALQRSMSAVELARTPSIPLGLAQASGMLALVLHVRGDLAGTKEWADKTLQYAREQGQPYWIALAGILDSRQLAARAQGPVFQSRRGNRKQHRQVQGYWRAAGIVVVAAAPRGGISGGR
jgi:tetratricopeptide (TPR) repeat protein